MAQTHPALDPEQRVARLLARLVRHEGSSKARRDPRLSCYLQFPAVSGCYYSGDLIVQFDEANYAVPSEHDLVTWRLFVRPADILSQFIEDQQSYSRFLNFDARLSLLLGFEAYIRGSKGGVHVSPIPEYRPFQPRGGEWSLLTRRPLQRSSNHIPKGVSLSTEPSRDCRLIIEVRKVRKGYESGLEVVQACGNFLDRTERWGHVETPFPFLDLTDPENNKIFTIETMTRPFEREGWFYATATVTFSWKEGSRTYRIKNLHILEETLFPGFKVNFTKRHKPSEDYSGQPKDGRSYSSSSSHSSSHGGSSSTPSDHRNVRSKPSTSGLRNM